MSQQIMSWPMDADGNPMAIISGQASEKTPTTQFGNVTIGPVMVMLPVPASLTDEERIKMQVKLQAECQFVVARERRILQWALDPATKVANPANGAVVTPAGDVAPEVPASVPAEGETPADVHQPVAPQAPTA